MTKPRKSAKAKRTTATGKKSTAAKAKQHGRAKSANASAAMPAAMPTAALRERPKVTARHTETRASRVPARAPAPSATAVRMRGLTRDGAGNVDTSAAESARVATMWQLLDDVVAGLDSASGVPAQRNVKRFLLHVSWHEGAKLKAREQFGGGPARSFFQFEAHRAKDACAYGDAKNWLGLLAAEAGISAAALRAAYQALSDFNPQNPNQSAKFPAGNAVEAALRTSDLFGALLARIAFKKVPAVLPNTNSGHADYWYQYWKVSGGNPDALKATFTAECDEVDGLIP